MTVNQLPDKTARMEPTSPRDSTMSLKTSAAYSRIDFSLRHERGVQRKWTSQLRKSHYENVFIFISFFTSMRVISILTKIYFSLSSPSLSSESEVHRITFKAHSIKAVFGTSKFKSSQFSQHSLSPFHEKNVSPDLKESTVPRAALTHAVTSCHMRLFKFKLIEVENSVPQIH